jgi:glycine cleavage system pyridoxal-binding protein P
MKRIDARTKNSMISGHVITAGYQVNEKSVQEMLQFMGVKPTEELMQAAIGFCSSHAMEVNMINIHEFLKERGIMDAPVDARLKKN